MATERISLHYIFRQLVDDDNFLKKIINNTNIDVTGESLSSESQSNSVYDETEKSDIELNSIERLLNNYSVLQPYNKSNINKLPKHMHIVLMNDNLKYVRYGIKTVINNGRPLNISFLNCVNIYLRRELLTASMTDQSQQVLKLINFVERKIIHNYKITKIKNTPKVKKQNLELVNLIKNGIITDDIIKYVCNIFEINIVIMDMVNDNIYVYWTHGTTYAQPNFHRDILFMTRINDIYEPVLTETEYTYDLYQILYKNILLADIISYPALSLSLHNLYDIYNWNDTSAFHLIIDKYVAFDKIY
jgi:hypothetical protein